MIFNEVWTYSVNVTANGIVYPNVVSEVVNTADANPMTYPVSLPWYGIKRTETTLAMGFKNSVAGASTELYRAPTHEGPFELLATFSGETGRYTDTGLTPGTTYYYTWRGVLGEQTSAFAGISGMTTLKDFKIPEFEAEAMPDGSVHITLHDRGLSDVRYELIREGGGSGEIIETFVLPDSGTVVNYIDDYVLPDITYVYILDVFLTSGGATVGFDTVTTFSTEADLGYLHLVDPFYDGEMGYYITDGFVTGFADMNIAVQANDLTKSVVFYLNGERSIDNTPPFAVLPDDNGDFESLNLPNGEYILTAIAYPEQNAGGTATDTITVNFTVHIEICTDIGCFTLVDPETDEDIESIEEGEIFTKPAGSYFNLRFNPAFNPRSVEFKVDGKVFRVENAPPFSLAGDLGGDYMPWKAGLAGTYSIEATPFTGPNRTGIRGGPVSITFTIVQPEITEPGFVILNADTDEDIQPLNDGDVFVKPAGVNINIRYDAIDNPGSVVFKHQGEVVRKENAAPFTLAGDYGGNYLSWQGAVSGTHHIDATPYQDDFGKGTAGPTLTIHFSIQDEAVGRSDSTAMQSLRQIQFYPNPLPASRRELTFFRSGDIKEDTTVEFEIMNLNGEVVFAGTTLFEHGKSFNFQELHNQLTPGLYVLRMRANQAETMRRLLVK